MIEKIRHFFFGHKFVPLLIDDVTYPDETVIVLKGKVVERIPHYVTTKKERSKYGEINASVCSCLLVRTIYKGSTRFEKVKNFQISYANTHIR